MNQCTLYEDFILVLYLHSLPLIHKIILLIQIHIVITETTMAKIDLTMVTVLQYCIVMNLIYVFTMRVNYTTLA